MELIYIVKIIAASLTFLSLCVQGAIKCYCNRPECQNTRHTCISFAEKCYSKLYSVYSTPQNDTVPSRDEHGCVDLMKADERSLCNGNGDSVQQLKSFEPLIMCCADKMCNYRQNQDIHVDIIDSQITSTDGTANAKDKIQAREDNPGTSNSQEDVIFRTAVIAVPIAGGLILIVLILMAVRMLREDYHRRSETHSSLEKAQSFIEQHFTKKDCKIRLPYKSKKLHKSSSKTSSNKLTSAPVHTNNNLPVRHWNEAEEALINNDIDTQQAQRTQQTQQTHVSLLPPNGDKDRSNV